LNYNFGIQMFLRTVQILGEIAVEQALSEWNRRSRTWRSRSGAKGASTPPRVARPSPSGPGARRRGLLAGDRADPHRDACPLPTRVDLTPSPTGLERRACRAPRAAPPLALAPLAPPQRRRPGYHCASQSRLRLEGKPLHPYKTPPHLHTCAHAVRLGRHGCFRVKFPPQYLPATVRTTTTIACTYRSCPSHRPTCIGR
jgi:hypothetical protein